MKTVIISLITLLFLCSGCFTDERVRLGSSSRPAYTKPKMLFLPRGTKIIVNEGTTYEMTDRGILILVEPKGEVVE